MKSKVERVFMVLLIILAIWNMYCVYNCYQLCNIEVMSEGGLGIPTFNIIPSILVIILQIINIILLILILKEKDNRKIINLYSIIVLIIFIVTLFIPVYRFPILYPRMNLYGYNIF